MPTPTQNPDTPAVPLRGEKLLKAAVNQILAHPETWNQVVWHCDTGHCIAGWCQILAGRPQNSATVADEAMNDLGISFAERAWLFAGSRRLVEIYGFAERFSAGFDRDGRDRAGFDRAGFDRDGFDRYGFDRAGRDRDGFNCDGFDRYGFDRAGRDRAGFDRAGRDRAGRDRAGFDRDGKPLQPFDLTNL